MTSSTDRDKSKSKTFPATIARILSPTRIVINRGSEHGIKKEQKMLVYSLEGEEVKDPNTGESLGNLETYKGTGKIISVQEKTSILESDRNKSSTIALSSIIITGVIAQKAISDKLYKILPFENPKIGDLVKPI